MRKKVIVSTYAISPFKGSEYAVAWNAIINIAKEHDVWVLYGSSDDYMGDTQTIRKYLESNPIEGAEFIEVKAGKIALALVFLSKIGFGWFFYFALPIWQKKAYIVAKNIVKTVDISLAHHFGPIGFREPGYLWKLNLPFVWGPIGATKIIDLRLLQHKSFKTYLTIIVKNCLNFLQLRFSSRVKKAMLASNVLLAATLTDQRKIKEVFDKNSYHFPENGIFVNSTVACEKFAHSSNVTHFVWCGVLSDVKNLQLAFSALSKVKYKNWIIHVIGDGLFKDNLLNLSKDMDIQNNIIWHGHIPRSDALDIISKSHLHIITSITEANTTVLFEAMSFGVPTITIDHCGMADIVNENCGIKIKIDKFDKMSLNMAKALTEVIEDQDYLLRITNGVKKESQQYRWPERMEIINACYNEAIDNWQTKNV